MWHDALAPPAGACMPALTRHMTLTERDMLAIAQIARPWWRWVRGGLDTTDTGLASLAAGCTAITTLDLSRCDHIRDAGLASLVAGFTAITTLHLSCYRVTDTGLASLAAGCPAITTLYLSGYGVTDTGPAGEPGCWMPCHHHAISLLVLSGHGHWAGESGCWVHFDHHSEPLLLQTDHGHRAGKFDCWMFCHHLAGPL